MLAPVKHTMPAISIEYQRALKKERERKKILIHALATNMEYGNRTYPFLMTYP